MAVVYQHRRLDNFEVFYVGIGKSKSRAFSIHKRNDFWYKVVNKTEYIVELILEDVSYNEAKEIEKLLIDLHGRKDLGQGTLVNLTDGGDGTLGYNMTFSDEHRSKLSKAGMEKHFTEKHKQNISKAKNKEVAQLDLNGNKIREFKSVKEAAEVLQLVETNISVVCRKERKTSGGFKFKYV